MRPALVVLSVAAAIFLVGPVEGNGADSGGIGSVTQGMSRAEVVSAMGRPSGTMRLGGRDILIYADGEVELSNDRVMSVRRTSLSQADRAIHRPPPPGGRATVAQVRSVGTVPGVVPATMAHEILRLEARFGAGKNDEALLNQLLLRARKTLKPAQGVVDGQGAKRHLEAIQAFMKEEGFRYQSTAFLHEALRSRNTDCDTSTLIYCAIGEVMEYPLGAVVLPRHAFVRWVLPHGGVINWETTEMTRNASFSDGSYYDWLLKGMTGEGCNLKTLTRQQLPAIHHYMAGLAFASMKRYDQALEEHDAALGIDQGWYISRLEKSSVQLLRESYSDGAFEALKAMEYIPADELGQLTAATIALSIVAKQDASMDRKQLGRIVRGFMRPDSDSAGYVILTALDSYLSDRASSAMADLDGACGKWPTNFVPFLCRAAVRGRTGDAMGARKDAEEAMRLMRASGVTRNIRALQSPARREERQR